MTDSEMLDLILTKLDGLEKRVDEINLKLQNINERLDDILFRLDSIIQKLDYLVQKLDSMVTMISKLVSLKRVCNLNTESGNTVMFLEEKWGPVTFGETKEEAKDNFRLALSASCLIQSMININKMLNEKRFDLEEVKQFVIGKSKELKG